VRGLLGLEGDAINKTFVFSPHFPADWKNVKIHNYKIGNASFSIDFKKSQGKISVTIKTEGAEGYKIHFAPNLSATTKIQSLSINGEPAVFNTIHGTQTIQIRADIHINGSPLLLELDTVPALEILPVIPRTKVGNRNIGLKILSVRKKESSLVILVEGLAKTDYVLRVLNPEMAKSVFGAVLKGGQLKITIPEGPKGKFMPHLITIQVR
jgi:hypothetical protein